MDGNFSHNEILLMSNDMLGAGIDTVNRTCN